MTRFTHNLGRTAQPSIASLTAKLVPNLPRHPAGESEVEPYEVVSGFRADASSTWRDACQAFELVTNEAGKPSQPGFWTQLVRAIPVQTSLPVALGTFPQLAADLESLLKLKSSRIDSGSFSIPSSIREYLSRADRSSEPTDWLFGAAVARLMGDFATAKSLLERIPESDANLGLIRANELAATLWMSGHRELAILSWEKLPASPMVDFNLGMAYLFTGRKACAVERLTRAVHTFSDTSGWKQLAQLYLSLAKIA